MDTNNKYYIMCFRHSRVDTETRTLRPSLLSPTVTTRNSDEEYDDNQLVATHSTIVADGQHEDDDGSMKRWVCRHGTGDGTILQKYLGI